MVYILKVFGIRPEDCNDDYLDGDISNSDEDRDFSENSRKFYSYDALGTAAQCGFWSLSTTDGLEIEISSGRTPWDEGTILYFNIFAATDEIINTISSN